MNYKHNSNLTERARELRKNMTAEEKILWYQFLKDYPVRFLRQKIIDNYIADFYCSKAKLVIELDGSQHYSAEGREYDTIRTGFIEKRGIEVLRIPNNQIKENFEGICRFIDKEVRRRIQEERIPPSSPCGESTSL
ncbi:MAG: endonuclease domain-containing protein [Oscillospiraceae bacterium]|nr:endonuclease domain-containing protein [Oscillospiraceae bacterium]